MEQKSVKVLLGMVGLSALLALGAGCSGGSTGGGDQDYTGDQYDNTAAGRITLTLVDGDLLAVSVIEGFRVHVKDQDGRPVENIPILCDTEAGLAIIEPTTGKEYTDSDGQMSGKIGCSAPGSYLLACRVGVGGGKRTSTTVRCQGPIPVGFDGFPSPTGGGGLGGGSSDNEDGGSGGSSSGVRITAIAAYDTGDTTAGTTSIDISQDADCDNDNTTVDPEPFYDTSVGITVVNNSNRIVRFTSLKYKISNYDGNGSSVTSSSISLVGEGIALDANGGQDKIVSLMLDANAGGKRVVGNSTNISDSGIKNIRFTLTGTNDIGDTVTVSSSTALSFDGFNRCS